MYVAASQEVQFDDVELYVTVFFFSRNVEQWISSYGRKIIKRPLFFFFFFFFANLHWKSWFRWRALVTRHHLTMLILMHKLLFLLSITSPHPTRLFQWEQRRTKGAWLVLVLIFWKNLFLFCLSANEKWKKWNIFLYLFREKKII